MLSFGGGKESRLLLGLLREFGESPRVIHAGQSDQSADIKNLFVAEPLSGAWAERLLPSIMSGAAHVYIGAGPGECGYHEPWHHYYSKMSPQANQQLSRLLSSLGASITFHSPLCCVPYNIIQKMLSGRYAELFAHQQSVKPNARSEKNLHVSLLKLYHGLPFWDHCTESLFRELLHTFVEQKRRNFSDFRSRNHREVIQREMMAIIARCRSHPLLKGVAGPIPDSWDAPWIDYLHSYVDPALDPRFLRVFYQYASEYQPRPGEYVVPTPSSATSSSAA
jgi:hypothetical protein